MTLIAFGMFSFWPELIELAGPLPKLDAIPNFQSCCISLEIISNFDSTLLDDEQVGDKQARPIRK
jgi:hypothetical protein